MSLVQSIQDHASTQGAQGRVALARLSLKLGKKLTQVTSADEAALRRISKEVFGRSF